METSALRIQAKKRVLELLDRAYKGLYDKEVSTEETGNCNVDYNLARE
jgi:hypothetical protein